MPLTLDSIFKTPPDLRGADASRLRVLVATGDIIPARTTNWKVVTRNDFLYPYRATVDYLRQSDLLFVNLEAPLMASCPITREGFKFCGDGRHIQGLAYAKVSVASLANNHLTNYGPAGTNETIGLLNRNGIAPVGLGLWTVRDVHGIRFGFLAFNGVGERIDRAQVAREIGIVRPQADVVVVAFHWGKEYESVPQSAPGIAPDDPRALAHETIDLGADLVIGNHPHWVQGVELYHHGFVAYAHGNFIFDQMWSRETQEGVVGRYTFYDKALVAVEYRPVLIDDYVQPRFLEGDDAARVLTRMEDSSWLMAGPRPSPSPPRPPRHGAPG
jgi:poly-gamma-glutamate synthesis protein (capsule biosynthesis protein)